MKTVEFPFRPGHLVTCGNRNWVVRLVAFNEGRIVLQDKDSGEIERFHLIELYKAFYDGRVAVSSREGMRMKADSGKTAIAALPTKRRRV